VSASSIGKFQIVGQLGRGGMADVFVCRLQGIGGFDKEVVLKRIIPERAGDPHFVKMFLDEARVVANLNHPNIVQVFEIGEQDGIPYMAMEYVKGVTLSMIIREAARQHKINYGHCATLIAGVCDALEYAHNANGPDGEPLGLVHRDVTPGNIVVSREGTPKLLDFGVARARGRLAQTEAGTIKGKLRYMAPEQISQGPLDARADIFSLGVCLFEITTGQHPFGPRNGSEVATLKNIMNGVITRPSAIVPEYPPALDWIVMSAIEPDVHKRCPTAGEMRQRLDAFVASTGQTSTNREVVAWLRELFPDFGTLTKTGSLSAFNGSVTPGPMQLTPSGMRASRVISQVGDVPMVGDGVTVSSPSHAGLPAPKSGGGFKWAVLGTLVLAGAGAAAYFLKPQPPVAQAPVAQGTSPTAPTAPAQPAINEDEAAAAYLDAAEKYVKEKKYDPALDMLAKAKELKIRKPELNIRLTQLNDSLGTAVLLKKAQALVDAKNWRGALDMAKNALDRDPENKDALAILQSARTQLQPKPVETSKGNKERARDGAVTISTTPPAMIYVDDEPIGRSPITNYTIPAGKHTIQARAQGFKPSEQDIKVAPRQTVALVMQLTADGSASRPSFREQARAEPREPEPETSPSPPPAATTARLAPAAAAPSEPPQPSREPENAASTRPRPPAATAPAPSPSPAPVASTTSSRPAPAAPSGNGSIVSATPKSPIPKPTLPRTFFASDADQLARACALVESTIVSAGGVSPEYARGVTSAFRRTVGVSAEVYPVAMYYFLIREAAIKHDQKTAAANLAAAHSNGLILKFKNLPAVERSL
jgi:eukaryotic-like serine/threonine-protein kinase